MTTENAGADQNSGSGAPHKTSRAKPSTAVKRTASARPATSARAASRAANSAGNDITRALKDAAHAIVGFGVIGWNKTQVRRRELLKDLNAGRHQVETQLDGAKEQIATAIRTLDARIEPVRHDIDAQLDKVSERLPEQVRDVVASARKIARDTEHQVRQAVGAL
jgi:capsule polysaccharide export protein KpsE/RkpR